MGLIQQVVETLNLTVGIGIPNTAQLNHLDDGVRILSELLFQCALEVGRLQPRNIILQFDDLIMLFSLAFVH